jgi:hypothetical protein
MAGIVAPGVLEGINGEDIRGHEEDSDDLFLHLTPLEMNSQPLELYMHYARKERELERNDTSAAPDSIYTMMFKRASRKKPEEPVVADNASSENEKVDPSDEKAREVAFAEKERFVAYRALRTASWQGVIYLITTDILGYSTAPAAFLNLGYAGGVLIYFFFYVLAFLGGQILWRLYCDLDSRYFPVHNYSDVGERIFGRWVRHMFNILQSLQLILNVGLLVLGNAQTLGALAKYKVCFSVLCIVWMLVGMIGGQIKSLRNFAWFANCNIWLNVVVLIMTMVGVGTGLPVYGLNDLKPGPVQTTALGPAADGWYLKMAGAQYAVFSYGGAMIFIEFMAEMRRPLDFWKAAFISQTFIFLVYMFYGMFVYAYQGQFTYIISSLGITSYGLLLGTNIIGLFTTIVAAVLYGNIGVKSLYFNIFHMYFNAPELNTRSGTLLFAGLVFIYWALAFVIASAIPNLSAMVTLVASVCILHFTFTFPPALWLGYLVQKDAMEGDNPWTPETPNWTNRVDTWRNMSRWKRGFRNNIPLKLFLLLIVPAALAFAALGIYSGVEQIKQTFEQVGSATSFSCCTPGDSQCTP